MNENKRLNLMIILTIIISVALSVSLSIMLIMPREGQTGPPGPSEQGIQGEQGPPGPQGPPGEAIVGPSGESFSLAGTWKCILDAGDHFVADILEVEVTSGFAVVQWEYHNFGERYRSFTITIRTLDRMEFKESSSAEYGSGVIYLIGNGRYTIITHSNNVGSIDTSIKVYQLE